MPSRPEAKIAKTKMLFDLPTDLVKRFRTAIPVRRRTQFVIGALELELAKLDEFNARLAKQQRKTTALPKD